MAILPTGYGKSLCFQMPLLLTNRLAIVISQLIALMADQKRILYKLGMGSYVVIVIIHHYVLKHLIREFA